MRNYQRELDQLLSGLEPGKAPRLLLHACCAPCSSYVLEYLSRYFQITVLYYNPNISPGEEYRKRAAEARRFIRKFEEQEDLKNTDRFPVSFEEGPYEPEAFFEMAKGLEEVPEGGERCFRCYEQRLRLAAKKAAAGGYDYFCTTLSISPLKNAHKLMEIGERLAEEYGVSYLPSDFKKRDGYKRSVELSGQYGLYRQNYCGCVFSKRGTEQKLLYREAGTR